MLEPWQALEVGAEEGADGFICVVRSFALALFSSSMNALALGSVPLKPELVDVTVPKLLGDHPGGGLNPNGTMCGLEGLGRPRPSCWCICSAAPGQACPRSSVGQRT